MLLPAISLFAPPIMQLASVNPVTAGTFIKNVLYEGALEAAVIDRVLCCVHAEWLRAAGYKVDVVGGARDQGVDLLVKKGRKLIAVQCKKYGRPVGNAAVSAVYAGAKHYGAKQAWVVAPEGFTKGAIELAKSTGVRLMGRKGIDGLLQDE